MNVADQAGYILCYHGELVNVPTWQALDVSDKPQGITFEITNYTIQCPVEDALNLEGVSVPWAENQFKERVAGPANPGETYKEWPWYAGNVEAHKEQGRFSHTYMDRYWPDNKEIGQGVDGQLFYSTTVGHLAACGQVSINRPGSFGGLGDVVALLAKQPTTRQAYLPVFFPFDTGAVHGERIPCSLGYLFLMRENKLNITYYIRSCDFYRHFCDDVYMTARLCQWVLEKLKTEEGGSGEIDDNFRVWHDVEVGRLTMHIGSLHVFEGDLSRLRRDYAS